MRTIHWATNRFFRSPPSLKSSIWCRNKLHVTLRLPTLEDSLMHQAAPSPAHCQVDSRTAKLTRATSSTSLLETPRVRCWLPRSASSWSKLKARLPAQWRPSPRPSPPPPLTPGQPPTPPTSGAPRRTLSSTQPPMVWSMRYLFLDLQSYNQ